MALTRNANRKVTRVGTRFVNCVCSYTATYEDKTNNFDVVVDAIDLSVEDRASPTEEQISLVADARAGEMHDNWVDSLRRKETPATEEMCQTEASVVRED